MIKWPVKYTNYNGEEVEEDLYFNLNKAEVMEMQLEANNAYGEYLQSIVAKRDGKALAQEYRRLILKAYGEKSVDGRRFVKTQELTDAFEQSEAYVTVYMQLATEEGAAQKFIEGVMPKIDNDANPNLEQHMTLI